MKMTPAEMLSLADLKVPDNHTYPTKLALTYDSPRGRRRYSCCPSSEGIIEDKPTGDDLRRVKIRRRRRKGYEERRDGDNRFTGVHEHVFVSVFRCNRTYSSIISSLPSLPPPLFWKFQGSWLRCNWRESDNRVKWVGIKESCDDSVLVYVARVGSAIKPVKSLLKGLGLSGRFLGYHRIELFINLYREDLDSMVAFLLDHGTHPYSPYHLRKRKCPVLKSGKAFFDIPDDMEDPDKKHVELYADFDDLHLPGPSDYPKMRDRILSAYWIDDKWGWSSKLELAIFTKQGKYFSRKEAVELSRRYSGFLLILPKTAGLKRAALLPNQLGVKVEVGDEGRYPDRAAYMAKYLSMRLAEGYPGIRDFNSWFRLAYGRDVKSSNISKSIGRNKWLVHEEQYGDVRQVKIPVTGRMAPEAVERVLTDVRWSRATMSDEEYECLQRYFHGLTGN